MGSEYVSNSCCSRTVWRTVTSLRCALHSYPQSGNTAEYKQRQWCHRCKEYNICWLACNSHHTPYCCPIGHRLIAMFISAGLRLIPALVLAATNSPSHSAALKSCPSHYSFLTVHWYVPVVEQHFSACIQAGDRHKGHTGQMQQQQRHMLQRHTDKYTDR